MYPTPCRFQKELLTVNLDTLAARLKHGQLQPNSVITMRTLQEAGIIGKKVASGVKLLGGVCCFALLHALALHSRLISSVIMMMCNIDLR